MIADETAPAAAFENDAVRAFATAAQKLAVDPALLASGCAAGELADVIIELRLARFNLPAADQERVENLLRGIGVLP
jgi:hypothetical protein